MISAFKGLFNSEDPLIQKYRELLKSRRFSMQDIKAIINRFLSGNNRLCTECKHYTESRECHGKMTEINIDCGPLLFVSAEEGHKASVEYILSSAKKRNLSGQQFIDAAKKSIESHDLSVVRLFSWAKFSKLCEDNFGTLKIDSAIAESYVGYVSDLFITINQVQASTRRSDTDEFFQSSNIGTLVPIMLPEYMDRGWFDLIDYIDQANFYQTLGLSNDQRMWAAKDKLLNTVLCLWAPEQCCSSSIESYRVAAEILIDKLDVTNRHRLWLRKIIKRSIMGRHINVLVQRKKGTIIMNERKSTQDKQYDLKRLQSLLSDDDTCFVPSAIFTRKDWFAIRSNQVPWRYFFNRNGKFRPNFKCCLPAASFCFRDRHSVNAEEDQELMDESIWSNSDDQGIQNSPF